MRDPGSIVADELAFWKHQAIYAHAWCAAGGKEPGELHMRYAETKLEEHLRREAAGATG